MAQITQIIWEEGPGGNVEHVGEHGVTPEEVDQVIRARFDDRRISTRNPRHGVVEGQTSARRWLRVVFAYEEDLDIVVPVTAFEPVQKGQV